MLWQIPGRHLRRPGRFSRIAASLHRLRTARTPSRRHRRLWHRPQPQSGPLDRSTPECRRSTTTHKHRKVRDTSHKACVRPRDVPCNGAHALRIRQGNRRRRERSDRHGHRGAFRVPQLARESSLSGSPLWRPHLRAFLDVSYFFSLLCVVHFAAAVFASSRACAPARATASSCAALFAPLTPMAPTICVPWMMGTPP